MSIMRASEMAADWWAVRLSDRFADKREAFRTVLERRVSANLLRSGRVLLECDYRPMGVLLAALEEVGIAGVFTNPLPAKHSLDVSLDVLDPKEGYGNWTGEIKVPKG